MVRNSNQKRPEVTVPVLHLKFHGAISWRLIRADPQRDRITGIQIKHTTAARFCDRISRLNWWRNHADNIIIHKNLHSSFRRKMEICVNVIPSSFGYRQASIFVLHAALKMTVRVASIPAFYHWKVNHNLLNQHCSSMLWLLLPSLTMIFSNRLSVLICKNQKPTKWMK